MSGFIKLLGQYRWYVIFVTILGLAANVLGLYVPSIGARIIDSNIAASQTAALWQLGYVALATFIITVIQIYISTFFSEKVAFDIRRNIIETLSRQTFSYITSSTPGRLLTVVTSDVDAVKGVVSQGLVTLFGAIVTLIGAAIFLLTINVRLALYTLIVIPLLIISFALIFRTLATLFRKGQENIERINALINQSIVGASLVRVLNAASFEIASFEKANAMSREIGLAIVKHISALIPLITLLSNVAIMIIIWFGGNQVIAGTLSLGQLSAFIGYSSSFVWPLFVLSFVGTMISRGGVSLERINDVLKAPVDTTDGDYEGDIKGDIEFRNVSLCYGDMKTGKHVLKNISFSIRAGTKNAIVGPTAAGKTQLFYIMAGLVEPSKGEVLVDGRPLKAYKKNVLLSKIGLVFQDSIIFNASLRDNIALADHTTEDYIEKAIHAAELDELVKNLPDGLHTMVSERGNSLSGGQKQRLMLARALALNPRILLLDDFTARVDQMTEASILGNVAKDYADATLISITQKIEPVKNYEQIIVLMEGELVATGTHEQLIDSSFEYQQIYESQMRVT